MAKKIFVSPEDIEAILNDIRTEMAKTKYYGNISITKNFAKDDREAFIYFTTEAWCKMTALVHSFDTEVEWHGCVNRLSECEFEIYDIIVPPHTVTGSTVTADGEKYTAWINSLDDEIFNDLRFHGHSHVNMSCSPSSTDTTYRHDVVTQLPVPTNDFEDSFYIFLIFNKRGEWTGEIYDLANNALYSTSDIHVECYTERDGFLSDFIAEAKELAVKETPKVTTTYVDKQKNKNKKGAKASYAWDWKDDDDSDFIDRVSPLFARGY